jgi:arylsulfatase A-like enzyme
MALPNRWSRRSFLQFSALAATPLWEPPKPNILFVAFDDLNDWIGCEGGYPGKVHTPNIDRLASRGVLFTNAHCTAPVCNASRASLLTGVRPSTSGVYENGEDWKRSPAVRDVLTLPHYFREHGYWTGGAGKIFHALSWINYSYGSDQNDPAAWDEFYPSMATEIPTDRFPEGATRRGTDERWTWQWPRMAKGTGQLPRRTPPYYFDWGAAPPSEQKFADVKTVNWAAAQLAKNHGRPFFLAAGIFRPHIPWYVPKEYFDLYPLDSIVLPPVRDWRLGLPPAAQQYGQERRGWHEWIVANGEWKKAVQGYLAAITFADAQFGRLLAALDASPYARNTIVVAWGDNGFHLGERETWEKFTLWEESTKVPLIVTAPGQARAGGRCDRAVSLLDIYPTLVELTGGPAPGHKLEGTSLMPLLRNPKAPREVPAITNAAPGDHSVRTDRWRYTRYADGSEELYDHHSDPNEYHNLAAEAKYAPLKQELAKWLPEHPAPSVGQSR